jgi:hypothetical protein
MDGVTLVLAIVLGASVALIVVYVMRRTDAARASEYVPIVLDRSEKRDGRIPVTPINQLPPRPRTSSSGPVDVAMRLGGAPDIAIRPPLPEPLPVPPDQIPVAGDVGIAIRKRTPTGATMPSVTAALAHPAQVRLRGHLSYALTTAAFSGAGVTANREDGFATLVRWSDVVGIVARRLPEVAPYDGAPFVDVVSTAGATLRLLPWTEITGHEVTGDATERMRSLVRVLSAQCRSAQLDAATKAFLEGTGKPAQLPDDKTLAAHDAKLR